MTWFRHRNFSTSTLRMQTLAVWIACVILLILSIIQTIYVFYLLWIKRQVVNRKILYSMTGLQVFLIGLHVQNGLIINEATTFMYYIRFLWASLLVLTADLLNIEIYAIFSKLNPNITESTKRHMQIATCILYLITCGEWYFPQAQQLSHNQDRNFYYVGPY